MRCFRQAVCHNVTFEMLLRPETMVGDGWIDKCGRKLFFIGAGQGRRRDGGERHRQRDGEREK